MQANLLSQVKAVTLRLWGILQGLPTLLVLAVAVVISFAVGRMFSKTVTQVVKEPVTVFVHDTTTIHSVMQIVLHDTITPEPTIIQRLVEKVVPAETVITYVPISVRDSSAFASIFLVNKLSYDNGELTADAVNLRSRAYKHFAFDLSNNNFDVGTNSQGVWVLQKKQFVSWDGLSLGIGYNQPGGYLVAQTGCLFFHKFDLSARFTSSQYPWQIEAKWRVF